MAGGGAGGLGGTAAFHSTSRRPSFCASSIISEPAGCDQRLFGYSRCSRRMLSTASARSPYWFWLCASQNSASSLFCSFGSVDAARSTGIAAAH
jgi:hypothetical protein